MEYFRFNDHSKNVKEVLSKEQIQTITPHVCTFAGEVIKEDEKSVTVALIEWAMDGDIKHEFTYCILKAELINE